MITKLEIESYKLLYLAIFASQYLSEASKKSQIKSAKEFYNDTNELCKTIINFLYYVGKEKVFLFNDDFILR